MRESFRADLAELTRILVTMGECARAAMSAATTSLLEADRPVAEQVVIADDELDELYRLVDDKTYELLARQAPVASDLRSKEPVSLAERTQALVRAPVVAGLHSLAAGKLAHGRPDEDAFICGDDAEAKALALELAGKVVAGRALDAGPLARARALEGLTAVIVSLNKRYKGHAGIRVTGLP